MTGLLRDTLRERADEAGHPRIDPQAIISGGEQRVRRRRTGVVAASAALAAAAAGGAALVPQLGGDEPTVATGTQTFVVKELSYAKGDRIYSSGHVVDAGAAVRSYVRTDDGYVWTVASGDVIFGNGDTTVRIGRTSRDGYYLRADDAGSTVAWVEFPEGVRPEFVAYDTQRQVEVLRTNIGLVPGMQAHRDAEDPAYIYAVDDGSIYWHSHEGVVRYDLASGEPTVLGQGSGFAVADVANGLIAHQTDGLGTPSGQEGRIVVGPSLTDGRPMPHSGNALLSPDGTYISFEDRDNMFVNRTATGADVTPRLPGYEYTVVFDWLDDDTAAVAGIRSLAGDQRIPVDFLTCTISTGSCRQATDDTITLGEFAWPNGEHIGT